MIDFFRRLFRNKFTLAGFVILAFLVFMSCTAGLFFDYEQQALRQNAQERLQGCSLKHPFGTDQYGRDIFVRIMFGARISLMVAFSTAAFGLFFGTLIGATAGYFGGRLDLIMMRFMDMLLAIPSILLAICIVAAFGSGLFNLILANGIAHIPRYSRIMRSSVLSIKEFEYIEAARACGADNVSIIMRHVLPNLMGQLIVQATLTMALSILSVASLSFIGLGIQPPMPEWGSMLSTGKSFMRQYPHLIVTPGLSIMLATLSFNLIGDGLRDTLDPRQNR
jgi:peptide/nickel transport system permease protein